MNKKQIHTIVLQEEKIAELMKQNKELMSGNSDLWKINNRMRRQIKKLEQRANELNDVNV